MRLNVHLELAFQEAARLLVNDLIVDTRKRQKKFPAMRGR
jgi:hypothetical protein